MRAYNDRYRTSMVLKVVLNGVSDNRIRTAVLKAGQEDVTIGLALQNIRLAEDNLWRTSNQGRERAKFGQSTNRHGVAAAGQAGGNKKGGKGKKGGKQGGGKKTSASNKECHFCFKVGHDESRCFTKMARVRENREASMKPAPKKTPKYVNAIPEEEDESDYESGLFDGALVEEEHANYNQGNE